MATVPSLPSAAVTARARLAARRPACGRAGLKAAVLPNRELRLLSSLGAAAEAAATRGAAWPAQCGRVVALEAAWGRVAVMAPCTLCPPLDASTNQ